MSAHDHFDVRLPTLHEWYHVNVDMDGCEECSQRLACLRESVENSGATQMTPLRPLSVFLTPNRLSDDCDISTLDLGPSYYSYEVIPGHDSKFRTLVDIVMLEIKRGYRALRARATPTCAEH